MLDGLPAPLAAWATERVLTAYADPILQVHDGTNNHDVNSAAAIAAACGANAGRVSTWYDQSGNSRDITEGTNRPLIYNGTSLIANGSNACVQLDGTNDKLSRADALGLTGAPALTIAYVAKQNGNTQAWAIGASSASGTNVLYSQDTQANAERIAISCFGGSRTFVCATRANYRAYIFQIAASANISAATCWQSGSDLAQSAVSAAVPNISNQIFRLGTLTGVSFFCAVEYSHFFIWNSVLSGADLTTLKARMLAREAA